MKNTLTIFTPTYNRAHLLPQLYESLKSQTQKNFEWLIVDDGSTDETKNIVQKWIDEKQLDIKYIFQENKGKHIAINNGTEHCKTSLFLNVDSDDYLANNAVEEIEKLSEKIMNNPKIAAFTFILTLEKQIKNLDDFGKLETTDFSKFQWKVKGEMCYCYKTDILKKFPFPYFGGEKFCPESLIHQRIAREYDILLTNNILAFGEYQKDGLSSDYYQLMKKNPNAALLSYKEKIRFSESEEQKISLLKSYWDVALSAKKIPMKEKWKGVPLKLSIEVLKNRFFKKG